MRVSLASEADRRTIYSLRHDVYARELHQHSENPQQALHDALDDDNLYIVAKAGDAIAGFISITPPGGRYSIDKYLRRDELPFALDANTYELRILTVTPPYRRTIVAMLLMYAAFRWVEASGGTRIVAIGRREVRGLYVSAGMQPFGDEFASGSVHFVPMSATVSAIRERSRDLEAIIARMEKATQWELRVPFRPAADCFHGGAFFDAIGDEFDHLDRSASIINADVLDAWFPPSPRVLAALGDYLPWLLRTSPPTGCEGLTRTIARTRGVPPASILPGAGSSDLIFLALREWLKPSSRVLLPEPAYGEYAHVLEKVIHCRADRLVLSRTHQYDVDLEQLERAAHAEYDLIVLVNPNSPTGRHIRRADLEPLLRRVPAGTLVWIDETYVDYAGAHESLEAFAVTRPNIVICKSMSKVYALSGVRCAYLCASPHLLESLRAITPPWAVSLPAQVAGVAALQDRDYYAARYRETHAYRAELAQALSALDVIPGAANFLLCHLPEDGPGAAEVVSRCREQQLFLRDASNMGANLGTHAIRIAVKERAVQLRIIDIVTEVTRPLCV